MSPHRVSVVMSVYNGEKHLKEAVESILTQTFTDFEFIIVDDGSTDCTWEILTSYEDPRIVLTRNPENIGLTKSLNGGLEMARGEYIARMDADDISLPERLEKQVEFLENDGEVGLLSCSFIEMDEGGNERGVFPLPPMDGEIMANLLRGRNCLCHGAAIFRKECIEQTGPYRQEFEFAQDYDLWLRIAERYQVANLRQPLYERRIDPSAISMTQRPAQDKCARLAIRLAEERVTGGEDRLGATQSQRGLHFWQCRRAVARITLFWARELYRRRKRREAVRMLARSILNNPFQRDPWMISLRVLRRGLRRLAQCGLRVLSTSRPPSTQQGDKHSSGDRVDG